LIDPPQALQVDTVHTAVIRFTIPREEIQTVMGPAFGEVIQVLGSQGIAPSGPLFSYHFRMDPALFDFEVGAPVATPVQAQGRVVPAELPAGRVARTIYHGPYEGLGDAWGEFMSWIDAEGLSMGPTLWESYLTDPSSVPDPDNYQTELTKLLT